MPSTASSNWRTDAACSRCGCARRPTEGEANAALVRLLAKTLGVAARDVSLVAGATGAAQAAENRRRARDARGGAGEKSARRRNGRPDGTQMTRTAHRRQGDRGGPARQGRGRGAPPGARPRHHAGARGRAGRQQSGERDLCRQQGEDDRRQRHALVRSSPAGDDQRSASCLTLVARLNADPAVHGILVQLPLPPQIDTQKVIAAIDPAQGRRRLSSRQCRAAWPPGCRRSRPARRSAASFSPRPCMPSLEGLEAVVIGRSNIVGKPLAQLAARGERDGDGRAFADARSCRRCAGAPISCSPRSAAGDGARATGSSRARP